MKKALATISKYVIFLGLGVWIMYHMLHQLKPDESKNLISAISISIHPPWLLIGICVVGFLSHYVRAIRWRYLLETIDLKPTLTNTFYAVMIGYIANLALPRAGEVAKCTVLAKYEGMPAHKLIGTIVAERAFDLLCLLVIAVVTFFLEMTRINTYVREHVWPYLTNLKAHEHVFLAGLAVLFLVIVVLVLLYRRNRESKVGQLLKEMTHGILSIFMMKQKWAFLLMTVLMWTLYTTQVYLGLLSLHLAENPSVFVAMVVLVWGSVGLIITPGGIGLYPLLVSQILEGPYHFDQAHAQAFGWIAWAVQTLVIILLGVYALLAIHPYNEQRNAKAELDTR